MPSYFEQRERALLGDEYDALYAAPPQPYRGITVNTARCSLQQVQQAAGFAVQPSPFCAAGLLVKDADVKLGTHPLHHAGAFYVQEPSAAAPCDLLALQPGEWALDLCAAPGGKTSRLAAQLTGQGILVANEIMPQRAAVLKSNLERMGFDNVLITNETTSRIARAFAGRFNAVLADVPCSGEGMFRKEPQAVAQHNEGLVRQCAALAAQILDDAAQCVAPGGRLLLSTCTFSSEENEQQTAAFLQRHPDFALLDTASSFGHAAEARRLRADTPCPDIAYARRIYPCDGGEGQYMALFGRVGTAGDAARGKLCKTFAQPPLCKAFMQQYFPSLADLPCVTVGDAVYLLPQNFPAAEKLHLLRMGVEAGSVVKKRFVPSHHLFHVYGAQCTQQVRLSAQDARAAAYLHGEEITGEELFSGWVSVLVDGVALGGGKKTEKIIKNHYPKGLRNLK